MTLDLPPTFDLSLLLQLLLDGTVKDAMWQRVGATLNGGHKLTTAAAAAVAFAVA